MIKLKLTTGDVWVGIWVRDIKMIKTRKEGISYGCIILHRDTSVDDITVCETIEEVLSKVAEID